MFKKIILSISLCLTLLFGASDASALEKPILDFSTSYDESSWSIAANDFISSPDELYDLFNRYEVSNNLLYFKFPTGANLSSFIDLKDGTIDYDNLFNFSLQDNFTVVTVHENSVFELWFYSPENSKVRCRVIKSSPIGVYSKPLIFSGLAGGINISLNSNSVYYYSNTSTLNFSAVPTNGLFYNYSNKFNGSGFSFNLAFTTSSNDLISSFSSYNSSGSYLGSRSDFPYWSSSVSFSDFINSNMLVPLVYNSSTRFYFASSELNFDTDFLVVPTKNVKASLTGKAPVVNHSLTINATPSDATISVEYGGKQQSGKGSLTITDIAKDTEVNWSVHKDGWLKQSGFYTATEDKIIDVNLKQETSVFIDVEPDLEFDLWINSIYQSHIHSTGHYFEYSIDDIGTKSKFVPGTYQFTLTPKDSAYVTQKGSVTLNPGINDVNVNLGIPNYKFTIIPTPSNALVTIYNDHGDILKQQEGTTQVEAPKGTVLQYEVTLDGYVSIDKTSITLNETTSISPILDPVNNDPYFILNVYGVPDTWGDNLDNKATTVVKFNGVVIEPVPGTNYGQFKAQYPRGTKIEYEVSAGGVYPLVGSSTINRTTEVNVSPKWRPASSGTVLTVNVSPYDANVKVYVNDVLVNELDPLQRKFNVKKGDKVRVTASLVSSGGSELFEPYDYSFEILSNSPVSHNITLILKDLYSKFRIVSNQREFSFTVKPARDAFHIASNYSYFICLKGRDLEVFPYSPGFEQTPSIKLDKVRTSRGGELYFKFGEQFGTEYRAGYTVGYNNGFNKGYDAAIKADETGNLEEVYQKGFVDGSASLKGLFSTFFSSWIVLNIPLIGNITLGTILGLTLLFSLIGFFFGFVNRLGASAGSAYSSHRSNKSYDNRSNNSNSNNNKK